MRIAAFGDSSRKECSQQILFRTLEVSRMEAAALTEPWAISSIEKQIRDLRLEWD